MATPTDTIEPDAHELGPDIYADLEVVRAQGPVTHVRLPGGLLAWMVTGHDAVTEVGRHKQISRDGAAHWGDLRAGNVPPDSPVLPWVVDAAMFSAFGAEHQRLRKLMAPGFRARRISALAPSIEKITADALGDVSLGRSINGRGYRWLRRLLRRVLRRRQLRNVDLHELFSLPIPIAVIGELLGVDDDLFPAIKAGADALFDTDIDPDELGQLFVGLLVAIDTLIERKRANPDGRLISDLVHANIDGDTYTAAEVAQTVRITIVAGFETTVNLLDQAIVLLLSHPQVLADVLAGKITWRAVLDEVMRYASPAANVPLRFVADEDVMIAGVMIKKGEAILLSFAGTGRDPSVFDRPDEFDPSRANNKAHLGFGYGPHRCPGAALALLEAETVLPMLFNRFRMELEENPAAIPKNDGFITNGYKRVLVSIAPKN
ncbi:cytochrome P450 [Promicromonospora sp. AC04]|uniref:cytochrome P450 n=1 Tax=Promicromonospora sp. AC04 TaxID=2135723 RepID=UPI000D35A4E3|nr:cytochrome P450 [Promicromonospora sp. AC04]PUB20821.1 cytochrome P450 [Promicromonospora sp. AC04]